MTAPSRIMFLYWGRFGLSQFTFEIAAAAIAHENIHADLSISRQNECYAKFGDFGDRLFPVETFANDLGAISSAWRLPVLYYQLAAKLRRDRIDTVVELMPHVWSSVILPLVKRPGIKYVTIIHDANSHPGDLRSSSIKTIINRALRRADVIVTLSDTVARQLTHRGIKNPERIRPLFHPNLTFEREASAHMRRGGEPFKLLWLGRILPYKGLNLFIDAVQLLVDAGYPLEIGVYGEGALGSAESRLKTLNANVINRWLSDSEIAAVLPKYDALVLSHVEASQSGIAATALGAGLPAVATPVGGLVEQIAHGVTGLVAKEVSANSLAEAIRELIDDPELLKEIRTNIVRRRPSRSPEMFLHQLLDSIE